MDAHRSIVALQQFQTIETNNVQDEKWLLIILFK